MPKFSIITPVHLWNQERVDKFLVCAESVKNQIFKDFEWVVVDDGSTESFMWDVVYEAAPKVVIIHRSHNERVISYNKALEEAKGEWIVFLDSDDEFVPKALERLNHWIEKKPKIKLLNFANLYHHKDGGITYRDPLRLKKNGSGYEQFGGGRIVNGTFCFHRSVYEELGLYPGDSDGYLRQVDCSEINYGSIRDLFMGTPYDFSAAAQLEFPEMRQYFMVDHENEPNKIIKELGNPWGQDYYLWYKYTRKYHSHTFRDALLIVHPR